jgi:hypothetical protein
LSVCDWCDRDVVDRGCPEAERDRHFTGAGSRDECAVDRRSNPAFAMRSNEHCVAAAERRVGVVNQTNRAQTITRRDGLRQSREVGEILRVHHERVGRRRRTIFEELWGECEVVAGSLLERVGEPAIQGDSRRNDPGEQRRDDGAENGALKVEPQGGWGTGDEGRG